MSNRSIKIILEETLYNPRAPHFFFVNNILAGVTLLSVLSIILESVPAFSSYEALFIFTEYTAVSIFSLEYVARIYVHGKNAKKYIFSFIGIVDLLAVIPTFATFGNATFLKTARSIRILLFLRIIRIAKMAKVPQQHLLDIEHSSHLHRLNVQIYFVALLTTIILFGTLLYVAEGNFNPVYESIPLGMLEAAKITMGGVAQHMPESAFGNIVVVLTRFAGLTLFGLLVHIVGNSVRRALFGSSELDKKEHRKKKKHTRKKLA